MKFYPRLRITALVICLFFTCHLDAQNQPVSVDSSDETGRRNRFSVTDISLSALSIGLVACGVHLERNRRQLVKENCKQLQELDRNRKRIDFLSNIANDLKTPVSLIYNPIINLIERGGPRQDETSVLKNILKQTDRLSHMISILHNDSSTHEVKLEKDNLNRWLDIQMEDYRMRCDTCGLTLEFRPELEIGEIVFDKKIVSSAISDIIDNMIGKCRYGTVAVTTSERKGYYQITVKDQKRNQTRQPVNLLRRPVKDDRQECSSLSYAQVMIGLLGGHITFESATENTGCSYHIDIPDSISTDMISSNEITTGKLSAETSECNCLERFDTRNSSLLLVDDDNDLLEYMREDYSSLFRNIYTAYDGREALEIARTRHPDVIVCDIIMPRMNGYELCSIIKSDIELAHIPVILLTSRSNTKNQETGYKMGADCFMAKPFDSKIMYNAIANQLKSRWEIKKQYSNSVFSILDKDQTFSNADEQFILKLNRIIRENISNVSLNVSSLAEMMGMSRTTLFNKMNSLLGVSASQYIKAIRIEAAKQLLSGTDMPISQVAQEIGFAVSHYFSSVFKETVGLTPREFKEQCKFGNCSPNH